MKPTEYTKTNKKHSGKLRKNKKRGETVIYEKDHMGNIHC